MRMDAVALAQGRGRSSGSGMRMQRGWQPAQWAQSCQIELQQWGYKATGNAVWPVHLSSSD